MSFKVINPLKYYELDFYDFYDFEESEASQYKKKRLTIFIKSTNEKIT